MDLTKNASPLPSCSLVCDICSIKFQSQESLYLHYGDEQHRIRSGAMARCIFGYVPVEPINCLDGMFKDPKKKGAFIGLQYLRESFKNSGVFACDLCGVPGSTTIFQHFLSQGHKVKYIATKFNFQFEELNARPPEVLEKIAVVIAEVEGLQMFKMAIMNPNVSSKIPPIQVRYNIAERPRINRISRFKPFQSQQCLVPQMQRYRVPILESGSHSSGINEKNGKRLSEFKPLAGFKRSKSELPHPFVGKPIVSRPVPLLSLSPRSVNIPVGDKMHENNSHSCVGKPIVSRPVPLLSLSPRSVNIPVGDKMHENNSHPCVGKPIESRPVPLLSLSQISVNIPVGDKMHENNSLRATKLPTISCIPSINKDMAPNPIPPLLGSFCQNADYGPYSDRNLFDLANKSVPGQTSLISNAGHAYAVETKTSGHETRHLYPRRFHTSGTMGGSNKSVSGQTSLISNVGHAYAVETKTSGRETRLLYPRSFPTSGTMGGSNKSVSGQTSLISNAGHAYAVETKTSGHETRHLYPRRFHTSGTMGGSDFRHNSPSGQCSSEASLKQDNPSRYGYNSMNDNELSSKSYLPSGIMSVLNKEPSLSKSRVVLQPEDLPSTTSNSSCGQTSQSTNTSMPAKTNGVLSPDTLKILQGRDPTSVKSILKRLAEYCPELKQVNISLLVDVLFETGTLR